MFWPLPPILAQETEQGIGRVFVWSLVLIVALIGLFGLLQLYRKWMSATDTTPGAGFTLSDLRRYHKEGRMTAEEFEKAKLLIIGTAKAAAAEPAIRAARRERMAGGTGNPTDPGPPGTAQSGGAGGVTPEQGPRTPPTP